MKHKLLLLYAWLVRTMFFFFPDIPLFMRLRGWFYGLGMKQCGRNFQIAHSAIINGIEMCRVGENVYIANNCNLILNGNFEIGNEVMFGPGVLVSTGNHQFDGKSFRNTKSKRQDVSIGNGCWIGGNSTILGNAKIPHKSLIAAGSVVTHKSCSDISGIYGGVPARFIKGID